MHCTCLVWVSGLVGSACLIGAGGCAKSHQPSTEVMQKNLGKWREALKDPDSQVRINALNHLGNIGYVDPQAFAPVAAALKDKDPTVRKEAIRNMWKFEKNVSEVLAALADVKDNDADAAIRGNAQEMIKAIQDRQGGKRK
jgi:HEAT repeat protein